MAMCKLDVRSFLIEMNASTLFVQLNITNTQNDRLCRQREPFLQSHCCQTARIKRIVLVGVSVNGTLVQQLWLFSLPGQRATLIPIPEKNLGKRR